MGGEQAASVLTKIKKAQLRKDGKQLPEGEEHKMKKSILDAYEKESSCYFSTARLWDEGVILPT